MLSAIYFFHSNNDSGWTWESANNTFAANFHSLPAKIPFEWHHVVSNDIWTFISRSAVGYQISLAAFTRRLLEMNLTANSEMWMIHLFVCWQSADVCTTRVEFGLTNMAGIQDSFIHQGGKLQHKLPTGGFTRRGRDSAAEPENPDCSFSRKNGGNLTWCKEKKTAGAERKTVLKKRFSYTSVTPPTKPEGGAGDRWGAHIPTCRAPAFCRPGGEFLEF